MRGAGSTWPFAAGARIIAALLVVLALGWLSLKALDEIGGDTCTLPPGVSEVEGADAFHSAMRDASTTVGFHAEPVDLAEIGLEPTHVGTIPLRVPTDGEVVQPESFHRVEVSYAQSDRDAGGSGILRAILVYGYGRADPTHDAVVVDCGQVAFIEDEWAPARESESVDFSVAGYQLSVLTDAAEPGGRTYLVGWGGPLVRVTCLA